MINEHYAKRYCSEDISLIENYKQAINDNTQTWHCHHRREIDEQKTGKQLIQENLYYNRPASELIFLTKLEHHSLHNKGKNNIMFGKHHSSEARAKMSASHKGKPAPNKGKHHSTETRAKLSAALSIRNIGCYWWNNGIQNKFCRDCPGPEWNRGRV